MALDGSSREKVLDGSIPNAPPSSEVRVSRRESATVQPALAVPSWKTHARVARRQPVLFSPPRESGRAVLLPIECVPSLTHPAECPKPHYSSTGTWKRFGPVKLRNDEIMSHRLPKTGSHRSPGVIERECEQVAGNRENAERSPFHRRPGLMLSCVVEGGKTQGAIVSGNVRVGQLVAESEFERYRRWGSIALNQSCSNRMQKPADRSTAARGWPWSVRGIRWTPNRGCA